MRSTEAGSQPPDRRRGPAVRVLNRFRRSPWAMAALAFLLAEALAVLLLPLLFHMDPLASDAQAGYNAMPSAAHLLGTDAVARDMLARTLVGGRISLLVGVTAPFISAAAGLPLGLAAGYYRGVAEMIIMRLADVILSFPGILLSLILVTILDPSAPALIGVIGLVSCPATVKQVYASVLSIREQEYIASAILIGRSDWDILCREIFPAAVSPALVSLSFQAGEAIMQESALSFLGAGIRPPQVSWGGILSVATDVSILTQMPWIWAPSGVLIVLTMISFHLVGEGLRDALDPQMER